MNAIWRHRLTECLYSRMEDLKVKEHELWMRFVLRNVETNIGRTFSLCSLIENQIKLFLNTYRTSMALEWKLSNVEVVPDDTINYLAFDKEFLQIGNWLIKIQNLGLIFWQSYQKQPQSTMRMQLSRHKSNTKWNNRATRQNLLPIFSLQCQLKFSLLSSRVQAFCFHVLSKLFTMNFTHLPPCLPVN